MSFITPVAMFLPEEHRTSILDKLTELGYRTRYQPAENSVLVTNWGHRAEDAAFCTPSHSRVGKNTLIEPYNPELFLALAAMTDDPEGIKGEWWVCTAGDMSGGFTKGGCYQQVTPDMTHLRAFRDNNGIANGWGVNNLTHFRKATKEELMAQFQPKADSQQTDNQPNMKQFAWPMSITGLTDPQIRELATALKELGYFTESYLDLKNLAGDYPVLTTRYNGQTGRIGVISSAVQDLKIEGYQKDLILDLAAVCTNDTFQAGEPVTAGPGEWMYIKGYTGSPVTSISWRRPTLEELFKKHNYFPQQTKTDMNIIGYNIKPGLEPIMVARALGTTTGLTANGCFLATSGSSTDIARALKVLDVWFDPVYEEEFEVGDWITWKNDGLLKKAYQITRITPDAFYVRYRGQDIKYGKDELLSTRKSTAAEITAAQKPESKTLSLGSNNKSIEVFRDRITVAGTGTARVPLPEIIRLRDQIGGKLMTLHGFDVNLSPDIRCIRVGCVAENNLFSLAEINQVIDTAASL